MSKAKKKAKRSQPAVAIGAEDSWPDRTGAVLLFAILVFQMVATMYDASIPPEITSAFNLLLGYFFRKPR